MVRMEEDIAKVPLGCSTAQATTTRRATACQNSSTTSGNKSIGCSLQFLSRMRECDSSNGCQEFKSSVLYCMRWRRVQSSNGLRLLVRASHGEPLSRAEAKSPHRSAPLPIPSSVHRRTQLRVVESGREASYLTRMDSGERRKGDGEVGKVRLEGRQGTEPREARRKLKKHRSHQKNVRFWCKVCLDHLMRDQQPGDLSLQSCGHLPVYSCFLGQLCTFRPECMEFVSALSITVSLRKCSPGDRESASPMGASDSGSIGCWVALHTRGGSAKGDTAGDSQRPTRTHLRERKGDQEAPGTGI